MTKKYDIITFGRVSIDLYSKDLGAAFEDIKDLSAYVGGSSTNIAVSCRRLGLRTALLTAVGNDKVGDFIRRFLENEGIETKYFAQKRGGAGHEILQCFVELLLPEVNHTKKM